MRVLVSEFMSLDGVVQAPACAIPGGRDRRLRSRAGGSTPEGAALRVEHHGDELAAIYR